MTESQAVAAGAIGEEAVVADAAGYGDTTEVLRVPVGSFVYFMAVMVAITGIVHLTKVIFPAPPRGGVQFDPNKPTTT
jgi:hypothetical protein